MVDPATAPDCEFHGLSAGGGVLAQMAVDNGGWETDLTVDTGVLIESSSSRADLPGERTIDVRIQTDTGDSGHLYTYGNGSLSTSFGDVICEVNGSDIITYTVEEMGGSAEDFVISWAIEPNPLTTGASDAYRSDLWVHNIDQDTWEHATATHAESTATAEDMVWLGSAPGSDQFTGVAYELRLCSAYHSSTETDETFSAVSSSPTLAGVERIESPVPTRASGVGDDGMYAGPVEAMAAIAVAANDLLMAGPAVNEVCRGAFANDSDLTMVDPDDVDFTMHLEFLRRRPVAPSSNRARVRVFLQQDAVGVAAMDVRCYCANAPGPIAHPSASPDDYERYYVEATRAADDGVGSSGGAWVDLGDVRLARDTQGYCWFWLGFDADSIDYWRIRAWTVEPVQETAGDVPGGGGFG